MPGYEPLPVSEAKEICFVSSVGSALPDDPKRTCEFEERLGFGPDRGAELTALDSPSQRGSKKLTNGFRVGMQAQMIPTLTSTADHMKDKDAYPVESAPDRPRRDTG